MALIEKKLTDVTRRYSSQWGSITARARREDERWWLNSLRRLTPRLLRQRSERDLAEEAELEAISAKEPLPTALGAFKNHPLYVLEKQLNKYECLKSRNTVVGEFRGEPVYRRCDVKQLHTPETWLKLGRSIRADEAPMKVVKAHVMMSRKKKLLGTLGETPTVGLYGEWQTEPFQPSPVVDVGPW